MKNILVVLMVLVATQMLFAGSQDVNKELNGPNDCGFSILPYFGKMVSANMLEDNSKCGGVLEPAKNKVVENNGKVDQDDKEICDFPGACGEKDYNVKGPKIIGFN